MRFKDVFSIIGPVMIGPSSSHTAGAVRIGRTARQALGEEPVEAVIDLYGSFADTYRGHGTDTALAAGIMDLETDDERIRDAFQHAESAHLRMDFRVKTEAPSHPNTAGITLRGKTRQVYVKGRSIGGGNIEIVRVDKFDVKFTAIYPTLLVFHTDRAGVIAEISHILQQAKVNIGYMTVDRESRNGDVLTVIECDEGIHPQAIASIREIEGVCQISLVDLTGKGEKA